jgi:hypothetical protein
MAIVFHAVYGSKNLSHTPERKRATEREEEKRRDNVKMFSFVEEQCEDGRRNILILYMCTRR